jgi:hypothetical protein
MNCWSPKGMKRQIDRRGEIFGRERHSFDHEENQRRQRHILDHEEDYLAADRQGGERLSYPLEVARFHPMSTLSSHRN